VRDRHYHVQHWPLREEKILGQKNVAHRALDEKTKIYLSPLHIKFGLLKIFVKAMTKEGKEFNYLRQKFPCISEAKIKEGIFVVPLIKQLFQGLYFNNELNAAQIQAMDANENVCSKCLGNKKIRKLCRNCGGATFHIPRLGVQHVVESPFPAIPLGFFSREIWEPSLTSTLKSSIRIYPT
jgi:hypothetical protein